uniref:Brain tumor proteinlike [Megachile rotundata] n=1 Tax=Lepeophtheirus salmonis TaxID=72036 RepID=A0A0K2V8R5_LEPSM
MVRQKSGNMTSPTPSIDSLNGVSLCGDSTTSSGASSGPELLHHSHQLQSGSSSMERASSSSSSSSSSGLGSSPLGLLNGNNSISNNKSNSTTLFPQSAATKCSLCKGVFSRPRVLSCFHTFCQSCLEKTQDHPDKLMCPHCKTETSLGGMGISSLIEDYGVLGLIDSGSTGLEFQTAYCTMCNNRETVALASCLNCPNNLCANCVVTHQFMHCFDGHQVSTLGEIKEGSRHSIQQLEPINNLVQEGRHKATEIRANLKNLEITSSRLKGQFNKAHSEIIDTFQFYTSVIEEKKTELIRELEVLYSSRQTSLSNYCHKAQETVDKIYQITDFIERLMKYANNAEVMCFKRPLEQKFTNLMNAAPDLTMDSVCDIEYMTNFQAIQAGVNNTFGYVRSRHDPNNSMVVGSKQPPISRPVSSGNSIHPSSFGLSQLVSNNGGGGVSNNSNSNISISTVPSSNSLTNSLVQSIANLGLNGNLCINGITPTSSLSASSTSSTSSNGNSMMLERRQQQFAQGSCFENNGCLLNKRFVSPAASTTSSNSPLGPIVGNALVDLNHPYDKWSTGPDSTNNKLLFNGTSNNQSELNESILDLSNKLLSASSAFPPKSQLKRQKMIYHCKFGEFGVLEGQFTEPSGVAVNAQNDIIVADTNNHRIQIFDKEGRFKFQFGECGKRDGQLLYPNRVAVVRASGDIIVTERSPTHQVQIYNQYGQFVRKFGANILQHPRGVCVDNVGRIIVVECKVMRVIIFDQMGNVLNKFGCSKHLEFPNGVVVNDRQEIFISDNRAHCVKVFNYEGAYLRQIGGEGITNYPIGVGINAAGEVTIADNHNNFNLSIFSQDGQLITALESKVKHAQCFDVSLMDDGSVVLASKDYRLYIYRYVQIPPITL